MTVSQILSYVMSIINQFGVMPYIQAGFILILAVAGIGAVVTLVRNR